MLISVLTAILNLMIAFRIVSFTSQKPSDWKFYFYTAVAVVLVATSFENAIMIIFVGEPADMSEFMATLIFAVAIYAFRGDIKGLFDFALRSFRNEKIRDK